MAITTRHFSPRASEPFDIEVRKHSNIFLAIGIEWLDAMYTPEAGMEELGKAWGTVIASPGFKIFYILRHLDEA